MTSISQNADERQPRHLKVATVFALGAIAVLGGNALLIRNTEPALAASEDVASASAFRILTPQTIDRLAGLSAPAATGGDAIEGVAVPAVDKTSCVATRAGPA
ncbi:MULTISPECIES: hypothetical protein [Agrobacterium]|uniref:hypothetical protein n=1 Tax=Agrobacterium TaxID=357 RepID=UPI0009CE0948|nr:MULTISPECIES: hypothetical protein [Agrobacterium]CUX64447.1 conserved hypothetical protein [Agrobacterium sp. NCPPB 925]